MVRAYTTLVIDLDGTLLNTRGEVSQANCQAIDRARAAGFEVIVASGRAWGESRSALEAINHADFMIAAGGALMVRADDGSTIDRRVMESTTVEQAVSTMLDDRHRVLLLKDSHAVGYDYASVGDAPLDPASQWWFEHLPLRVRHLEAIQDDEHPDATVRVAIVASEAELSPLAGRLQEQLADRVFLQHWPAVTSSHATGAKTHLLEVFDAGVNKWSMILRHCHRTATRPEQVVAIGDGLNDVEMIRAAGLGVAMGNADPRVLAVADETTGHHDADGVAELIDRLLGAVA